MSWCLQLRYISLTINDSPARGRCQHLFAAFLFGKKNAQNKSYNIILRSAMVLEENVQGTLWKSHDKLLLRAIVFSNVIARIFIGSRVYFLNFSRPDNDHDFKLFSSSCTGNKVYLTHLLFLCKSLCVDFL